MYEQISLGAAMSNDAMEVDEPRSTEGAANGENKIQRSTAIYEADDRFRMTARAYGQYAQTYFARLMIMRPILSKRAETEFPTLKVEQILNLPEGKECLAIGTVYKDMKLKPNVLSEYTKDLGVTAAVGPGAKLVSSDDVLILEDEKARMVLRGAEALINQVVTGVTMIVRGSAAAGGEFEVTDWRFAGIPPPQHSIGSTTAGKSSGKASSVATSSDSSSPRKYVALVSGLGIGSQGGEPLGVSLLVDWLTGVLGSPQDNERAAQVVRVVVAGGLLHSVAKDALAAPTTHTSFRAANHVLQPVKEMDMVLTELASGVPVDVMPGATDPASQSLPQQPLHRCMMPGASAFSTFNSTTNPHRFTVDGVAFLGTSGQNVDDVWKYADIGSSVDILSAMLQWRHLVPTAPDTLIALPQTDADPFVIDQAPAVLFAGNQASYGTRLVTGPEGQRVRLVALPVFSKTGTAVLVDIATLEPHLIQFDAALS